ncbi:hypothetical protein R1sor_007349 [Riccia sorocarpa]|uniref:Uncharacterized protein n=1 Tax=Riccia sorocarpa TaxID=122646 RepID=A0ABD3HQJ0_9MARC
MDNLLPATEVEADLLWAVLDEAEILRPPIRHEVTNRRRYNTMITALRDEAGFPVWAHGLWNTRSVPPHTGFGTLLEGLDGYYRAGIEVGVGGYNFSDVPDGATITLQQRYALTGEIPVRNPSSAGSSTRSSS